MVIRHIREVHCLLDEADQAKEVHCQWDEIDLDREVHCQVEEADLDKEDAQEGEISRVTRCIQEVLCLVEETDQEWVVLLFWEVLYLVV